MAGERTDLLHDEEAGGQLYSSPKLILDSPTPLPWKSLCGTTGLLHDRDEEAGEQVYSSPKPIPDSPTPLPWKSLCVVLMLAAAQPIGYEIIFPFVNQMILENGVVTTPEQVGFYSGLIESIYAVMSLIAVLPAGHLADMIGRKPVVLWGTLGLAVSIALFGMSKSLPGMIISRCIGGVLAGVWACTKTMVAEQSDVTNQDRAFIWLSIAYRTGQTVALPIGGILAHPERHFSLLRSKFWLDYPFALPCFVASAFIVFAVAAGYIALEETLKSKKKFYKGYGSISNETQNAAPNDKSIDKTSYKSVLTLHVTSILLSCVGMCLASECLFALFPLFSFTPITSGGLGLNEVAIGTYMSIRAVLHVAILPLFSIPQKYFGSSIRFYRATMCLWPITVLFLPLLNFLARSAGTHSWLFNIVMVFFLLISSLGGYGWVTIYVIITDASPSASALSKINGLSQMALLLPQAIAPAFVTSLFAFSIKSGIAGGNLVWVILFLLTCVAAMHSMTLREPTSNWREENQKN